jgi:ABC-type uncharacterized transport system permease subunit
MVWITSDTKWNEHDFSRFPAQSVIMLVVLGIAVAHTWLVLTSLLRMRRDQHEV